MYTHTYKSKYSYTIQHHHYSNLLECEKIKDFARSIKTKIKFRK